MGGMGRLSLIWKGLGLKRVVFSASRYSSCWVDPQIFLSPLFLKTVNVQNVITK